MIIYNLFLARMNKVHTHTRMPRRAANDDDDVKAFRVDEKISVNSNKNAGELVNLSERKIDEEKNSAEIRR